MITCSPVPIEYVSQEWPHVARWFDDAVGSSDGWWTLDLLAQRLLRGQALLWVVHDAGQRLAALVTELERWPDGRTVLVIAIMGGAGLADWLHLLPVIESYGVEAGATALQIRGRRGWSRVLTPAGYQEMTVTLQKDLDHGIKIAPNVDIASGK